jgi:hypothetical protein
MNKVPKLNVARAVLWVSKEALANELQTTIERVVGVENGSIKLNELDALEWLNAILNLALDKNEKKAGRSRRKERRAERIMRKQVQV